MTSNQKLSLMTQIPLLSSLTCIPSGVAKMPAPQKNDLSATIHVSISREESG